MNKLQLQLSQSFERAQGVQGIIPDRTAKTEQTETPEGVSFSDLMVNKIQEVNNLNMEADHLVQKTIAGENISPHTTLIALQKADISFRLLMSVKERIVQAYQEVLRMPIG